MEPILQIRHLTHTYGQGTPFCRSAIEDVSFEVREGEFLGLIGHTGSGKSTLIQHLNGLLKPTSGQVLLRGKDIWAEPKKIRNVRFKIGLVFQYPEYQLFEETVLKDVCFGPKNIGMKKEEAEAAAKEALGKVGIREENYDASPFELSGGEKRRVALAGVLAMKPEVLILDEPTAGLDPQGREEILKLLSDLHKSGMTILLVSHSMEDVAENVERILVMDHGTIVYDGDSKEVFSHVGELEEMGLAVPAVTYILRDIHVLGLNVRENITTEDEAVEEILAALRENRS